VPWNRRGHDVRGYALCAVDGAADEVIATEPGLEAMSPSGVHLH
jgi:hypothetical protein